MSFHVTPALSPEERELPQSAVEESTRPTSACGGMRFALSPRERVGVRGNELSEYPCCKKPKYAPGLSSHHFAL